MSDSFRESIKANIYDILVKISVLYNEPPSEQKLMIYCSILSEYDLKDIKAAIKEAVKTCKYYPSLAEIIDIIKNKPNVSHQDESNEMAGAILEAVRIYGYGGENEARIYLGPEAWHVVERFGGWRSICMTDIDALPTIRAQLRSLSHAALSYKEKIVEGLTPKLDYERETIKRLSARDTIDYLEAHPEQIKTSC